MTERRSLNLITAILFLLTLGGCHQPAHQESDSNVDYYTCAMHPSVHSHNPHDKCPICSMELIPVYKKSAAAPAVESTVPPGTATPPATTSEFEVSASRLQSIGVQSETVKKRVLERTLRAPAIVEIDESGLRDINVKASGYIIKLNANYVGKWVNKGEPLMTVLTEGWIDAQVDYIKAYRAYRRSVQGDWANRNSFAADNAIERMRSRIRVWDLSDSQIADLEKFAMNVSDIDLKSGKGLKGTFELLSPITGHVQVRNAIEGMHFEAGQSLLQLVDLSHVWVTGEFTENQSSYLGLFTEMTVRFPSLPGKVFHSRVDFVSPHLMEEARRQKVRLQLDNPGHQLLPGMFGTMEGKISLGEKLALPASAVIPTGQRNIVFLDHGNGKLEPRAVLLGEKQGDFYEVLDGVKEGDRVITSANFLIDAESRIQGALKTWGEDQPVPQEPETSGQPSMPGMPGMKMDHP